MEVPQRWLPCPRKGTLIGKFLPFKTLLDEKYDGLVPEEKRWNIDLLFASISSVKAKLGLFIDLTNTLRFYKRKDIEDREITYKKLRCRGHGETPSLDQTKLFIETCQLFVRYHPTDIIGVHCTHGFNRTGFLICAYLVEVEGYGVDVAVNMFSACRPPGIYKQEYLNDLFLRYGVPEDAPIAPPLPDWCYEEDSDDSDSEARVSKATTAYHISSASTTSTSNSRFSIDDAVVDGVGDSGDGVNAGGREQGFRGSGRRFQYQSKTEFAVPNLAGVSKVLSPETLGQVRQRCNKMCGWAKNTFAGAQPVTLTKENLNLLSQPYKVSWKADGTRYMMLLDGAHKTYFIDRDNNVFVAPAFVFPDRKDPTKHLAGTLVDGEMVTDQFQGQQIINYLIYDVIRFKEQDVCNAIFSIRLLCIAKELIQPRSAISDKSKEPFHIKAKPFYELSESKQLLDGEFSSQLTHEVDGLIFQPSKMPYTPGRCDAMLKWKPPELNTVDFKLQIVTTSGLGMLPQKQGQLFVLGLQQPFSEMKVSKEVREADGKIVECKWDYEKNQWSLLRIRTDKSVPNNFNTAQNVCLSIRNPITKSGLLDFVANHGYRDASRKQAGPPPPSTENSSRLMPPPSYIPPEKVAKVTT